MAPSTATLFVVLGAVVLLRTTTPVRLTRHRIADLAAGLCALTSLALFVSSLLGIHWRAEHLGIRIVDPLQGVPLGYMSPMTAACLAGLAASLLALPHPAEPHSFRRSRLSLASASAVGLTSIVLLLSYALGLPALYGGPVIPPALSTAIAFLMLSTAIAALGWETLARPGSESADVERRASFVLVLLFLVLAAGIITTGWTYYKGHEIHYRAQVEQELLGIADLKAAELERWRSERLGDAAVFYSNPVFASLVGRVVGSPEDLKARADVMTWMEQVRAAYSYDRVSLLAPSGREILSAPEPPQPAGAHLATDVADVLRSNTVSFLDFHRDSPEGPIYLGVLVPLRDAETGRPLAALLLRSDPELYVYPFLKWWPTSSTTAETLLVRREGNEAVFLNELRFQGETALTLRSPLADTSQPVVAAALGREGVLEGLDYRGVPVLAAVRAVPDSPWFLVARMDLSEIYAPLREQLAVIVAVIAVLLLSSALGIGLAWRRQGVRYYRDRYLAAERLHDSERRFHRLLDSMMEGYQVIGPDYRYLYVNDAAARHGQRRKEELLGRTMAEAYPGIETTAMFARLRRCMERRVAETFENEFTYPDGSRAWFSLSMQPVAEGVGILSLDVTKRKQAEEELRATNADLERRIRERTAQLEASNEELEAFAYSVSHDLRSPLRAIEGFSRLLDEEYGARLDDEGRRLLGIIRGGTRRMDRLITDLLALSRASRAEIRRVRVDMTALAEACFRESAPAEIAERFEFVLDPLPDAFGDPTLLRQVWLNLFSNAVKFTAPMEIRRIEVVGSAGEGTNAYSVRDSGVGFDPEYAHKLFGVFQRLHDPSEFEGTGIGLAIVRRIVHRHGGRVGAEGHVNGGAAFWFSLPRKEET